ncbi:MAG TPA: glycoside hydrolase family protein [Candidatus Sulfopaludibacter sp.]|jgi:GH24 family phage-related lysozyme (muramidase)|nr:glycoside hydrolase family protein [Candidatus Sulfopaludibacter sp.]
MKTISIEGIKFIKSFEGCYLTTYDDLQPKIKLTTSTKIKGTLTIGWGHTGKDVYIGKTITQQEADRLLLNDLSQFIDYVNNPKYVPITKELNQNQFDALVSFAFNCGQGNLKSLCANRNVLQIATKIIEYNKSKGIVLSGLIRRRTAEKELFEKEIDTNETKQLNEKVEKIIQLEEIVKNLSDKIKTLENEIKEIEMPIWFKNEFLDIVHLINDKRGTLSFWRSIALSLRILRK